MAVHKQQKAEQAEQLRVVRKTLARQLHKLANIADDYEIVLSNGAYLGSLLGSTADDLDQEVR